MKKHFSFTNFDAFKLIPPLLRDGLIISIIVHTFFLIIIMVSPHISFSKKVLHSFNYDEPIIVDLDSVIISKETILPPPPVKEKSKLSTSNQKVAIKNTIPEDKSIQNNEIQNKSDVLSDDKKDNDISLQDKKEKDKPSENASEIKHIDDKKTDKEEKTPNEIKKTSSPSSLDDLLASVDKIKVEDENIVEVKKGIQSVSVNDNNTPSSYQPNSTADYLKKQLSVSYVDAIRIKLRSCWNIDLGAKDIKNMKIIIKTTLAPDGNINDIEILNDDSSSPWFRAVAESAKRALIVCSPYNLPVEFYQDWKNIVFTFYPDKKSVQ